MIYYASLISVTVIACVTIAGFTQCQAGGRNNTRSERPLNLAERSDLSTGGHLIEDFRSPLTIEVKPGPRPTFIFRLQEGEAPAGLLYISVQEETTGEQIWRIVYGSNAGQMKDVKAYFTGDAKPIQSLSSEVVQQISASYDSLAETIPPLRKVTYGTVPDGWSQNFPEEGSEAPELVPGKTYVVFATGAAVGNARFSVPEP